MSLENVIAFWTKVQDDKELQERVQPGENVPKLSKDVPASELEGLAKLATDAGFPCTPGELAANEAVIRFWSAVPKDDALQAELKSCEDMSEDAAAAETVRIAGTYGYTFTAEELNVISPVVLAAQSGALSENELDAVAGGKGRYRPFELSKSLGLARSGGFKPSFRNRLGPGAVCQYM